MRATSLARLSMPLSSSQALAHLMTGCTSPASCIRANAPAFGITFEQFPEGVHNNQAGIVWSLESECKFLGVGGDEERTGKVCVGDLNLQGTVIGPSCRVVHQHIGGCFKNKSS